MMITRKEDGQAQLCTDYRALNKRTKVDVFPIQNITEILDDIAGATDFSNLDMFAGFWQVELAENIQERTEFTCKYGEF